MAVFCWIYLKQKEKTISYIYSHHWKEHGIIKFVFGLQKDPIFFKRQKGTALNKNRHCDKSGKKSHINWSNLLKLVFLWFASLSWQTYPELFEDTTFSWGFWGGCDIPNRSRGKPWWGPRGQTPQKLWGFRTLKQLTFDYNISSTTHWMFQ